MSFEVDLKNTSAFAQATDPANAVLDFAKMSEHHRKFLAKRDAANPPAPESPSDELGRLESWKQQIGQRLENGRKSVERAQDNVTVLERRLKILTDERDKERPRPLRPFEGRKLTAAIVHVEETLSLQKDFLKRMQNIADAAMEESKRFPQQRYDALKLEVLKDDNLTKALRGKDTFNELRFTP